MLTNNDNISAQATEIHIPFIPHIAGRIRIIATWNTNVLKNDIRADTNPLFSAVKKDDANILNQLIKNYHISSSSLKIKRDVRANCFTTISSIFLLLSLN